MAQIKNQPHRGVEGEASSALPMKGATRAHIINGKALSEKIRSQIRLEVEKLSRKKRVPGLAVVRVGNNEASKVYVRNKIASCEQVGMKSFHYPLSEKTSEKKLIQLLSKLNKDKNIHGILVQLPLPKQMNPDRIVETIHPDKDVDGLHPFNLGRLALGKPSFIPCTPAGIMRILEEINYDCKGKEAVVVGRSNIVGKPIALLLLAQNATVTLCHSQTKDLESHLKRADLLIAAVGVPQLIRGTSLRKGVVVIDVGINRNSDGKLKGDVDFESAASVASHITPVPGGVGPMTIAMLLWNTLQAAKKKLI